MARAKQALGRHTREGGSASRRPPSERRAALVALAAELFAERGYRATTVREIAEAAGVLSGSLYHHFDSKESIIDELLSSYLDELLAQYRAIVSEGGPASRCWAGWFRPRSALSTGTAPRSPSSRTSASTC